MKAAITIRLVLLGLIHLSPSSCAPMFCFRFCSKGFDAVKGGDGAGDVAKTAGGASHAAGSSGGGGATGGSLSGGRVSFQEFEKIPKVKRPSGLFSSFKKTPDPELELPPPPVPVKPKKKPLPPQEIDPETGLPKPRPNYFAGFSKKKIKYAKEEALKKKPLPPNEEYPGPPTKIGSLDPISEGSESRIFSQAAHPQKLPPMAKPTVASRMYEYYQETTTNKMFMFLAERGSPKVKEWASKDPITAAALNKKYGETWITHTLTTKSGFNPAWKKALGTREGLFDKVSKGWMNMWGNKSPKTRQAIQNILSAQFSPFLKLAKQHPKYMKEVTDRTEVYILNWLKTHGSDGVRQKMPNFGLKGEVTNHSYDGPSMLPKN